MKYLANKTSSGIHSALKSAFKKIKGEFSDHLDAINQNTNEIQSNYEFLCELSNKMDKLGERIDEISMVLRQSNIIIDEKPSFAPQKLTQNEQEFFLAIYTIQDEKGRTSYEELAQKLTIPVTLVQAYLTTLISKGIPISKRYINNQVFVYIDPDFKSLQAKENILSISEMAIERVITH